MQNNRRPGTIHRTVTLLETALDQLHATVPASTLERVAVMVHRGMSRQQRSFHTPEHIFDLADPDDPHGTLAALFHDLVYHQVDDGFDPEISRILEPYIVTNAQGEILLVSRAPEGGRAFTGCLSIFGFEPGQALHPFGGLNEFLSALVMGVLLEGIVDDADLFVATACIEATIPFRGNDADGHSPATRLHERLRKTAAAMQLDLADDDICWSVLRAVTFANRDVRNFAEEDVGRFLDNTWKLLPETNPELRFAGVYSIRSYRTAVQKMRGFLAALNPDSVFQQYQDQPPAVEYRRLCGLARRNLEAATTYLSVKFLTASVLEALAQLTGGDAPVALFMGEIPAPGTSSTPIEQLVDYLPDRIEVEKADLDGTVYQLLDKGRANATGFDLQNAPLSLFVYRVMGTEDLQAALDSAGAMCDESMPPRVFLDSLPRFLVSTVAAAAARMVATRREALLAISESTHYD